MWPLRRVLFVVLSGHRLFNHHQLQLVEVVLHLGGKYDLPKSCDHQCARHWQQPSHSLRVTLNCLQDTNLGIALRQNVPLIQRRHSNMRNFSQPKLLDGLNSVRLYLPGQKRMSLPGDKNEGFSKTV